jgi:hypothetical protein
VKLPSPYEREAKAAFESYVEALRAKDPHLFIEAAECILAQINHVGWISARQAQETILAVLDETTQTPQP